MVTGIMWRDKPTLSIRRVRVFPDGAGTRHLRRIQLVLRIRRFDRTVVPDPFVEVVTSLGVAFGSLPSTGGHSTVISEEVAGRIKSSIDAWSSAKLTLDRAERSGPFTSGRDHLIEDSRRKMDAAIASLHELLTTGDRARLLW